MGWPEYPSLADPAVGRTNSAELITTSITEIPYTWCHVSVLNALPDILFWVDAADGGM